ncbi:MAG: sugar ABC transporter substrate-binding protein [Ilumatobacteraceae bacterium]|jgi:simple sugar transport system substrate-binding protein
MKKSRFLLASVATMAVAGATVSTASATTPPADNGEGAITIAMVTHSDDGVFWSVVKKGAEAAAKDLGIDLKWEASNNDSAKQAQMIEADVAAKVSGLAVSLPDPAALSAPVQAAVAAGIPVVTLNSGSDKFKELGAITHVGQDEFVAGQGAGEKFKAAGAKKVLCVMQEQGNVGLQARCDGAKDTFGGEFTSINTAGDADQTTSQSEIKAALEGDSAIDAIFATGPIGAVLAQKAAEEAGRTVTIGAVDLSEELLAGIEGGKIAFTIDQQQYLQGYLSVLFLYLNITNANTVGGGLPVYTGPGFVTKDNVAQVKELVAAGTR